MTQKPPWPAAEAVKGRRELNKEDKLRRIKKASRSLFIKNGYDEASTREIAQRAGVALGTLFSYAANKRDLLFLVVNDELDGVARLAAASVRRESSLQENLLSAFSHLYQFFGREPRLSRLTLREMQFYDTGAQAKRFIKTRDRMISLVTESVRLAQEKNEISRKESAETIGLVIFSVYQMEIRRWLSGNKIKVADGISSLERALLVILHGLSYSSSRQPPPAPQSRLVRK
jgi:AcrR family transcriptional regulator